VSTLSGLSAQQKQAKAQRDALDQQKSSSEANTQLRLIELQRQKMYSEYNYMIDEARRRQVMMQDDAELQLARQQDIAAANLGNLQNQSSFALGQQRNQMQQNLANLQNRNQFQIGQQQLGNQRTIGQGLQNVGYEQQRGQLDLGLQQNLFGLDAQRQQQYIESLNLDRQAADTEFQSGQQARNIEGQQNQQAASVLNTLAGRFLEQRRGGEQRGRARAQLQAQLGMSGGGLSSSDNSLMDADINQMLDEFSGLIAAGNFNADLVAKRLGLSEQEAQQVRQLGEVMATSQRQQAGGQRGLADAYSQLGKTTTRGQYDTALGGLNFERTLNNQAINDQYRLGMLEMQDQNALTGIENAEQYLLNNIGLTSAYQNNRLDINSARALNEIGMGTYKSARDIQYGIERASAELNKQFYDTALSSAGASVRTQAAAELANLRAARNSIQSPGLLSYLGAGLQGYQAISGALGSMNRGGGQQQQTVQQPVNQGFGVMPVSANSFTGANNYGFLSSYQMPYMVPTR
jgi:hypothetical protein